MERTCSRSRASSSGSVSARGYDSKMDAVLQQWILNLATDFAVPLKLLPEVLDGDDGQAQALNVKSLRGISPIEGFELLTELADKGLVRLKRGSDTLIPSNARRLLKTPGGEREVSFELTEDGGREWERVAAPDWRQMDEGSGIVAAEDDQATLRDWTWFSQDRDRLMAVLGWYPMVQDEQIDVATIRWEIHSEYEVKYWKRLSNVHVVNFRSSSQREPIRRWVPRGVEPQWFTAWRISRDNWYRKPWDMEGWPPPRSPSSS